MPKRSRYLLTYDDVVNLFEQTYDEIYNDLQVFNVQEFVDWYNKQIYKSELTKSLNPEILCYFTYESEGSIFISSLTKNLEPLFHLFNCSKKENKEIESIITSEDYKNIMLESAEDD